MNQNSLELVDRNGVVYKTVEKMAANLAALNAKFKIVLADGTEFGELEVIKPKKYTRTYSVRKGAYSEVYKKYVESIQVGQTVKIDVKAHGFDANGFLSSFAAAMGRRHGSGSYKGLVNEKTGFVEMLRILPPN